MTEVRDSRKEGAGRGIFATKDYKAGDIIEESPVLVFTPEESTNLNKTKLVNYTFQWKKDEVALALGCISLYNHDYDANARYESNYEQETMTITAVRKIASGTEIYVNYNGVPNSRKPIWFSTSD